METSVDVRVWKIDVYEGARTPTGCVGRWLAAAGARGVPNATLALVTTNRGRPPDEELRTALTGRAFTVWASSTAPPPDATARSLGWLERNTRNVGDLDNLPSRVPCSTR